MTTPPLSDDRLAKIQEFYDSLADIDADDLAELDVCSLVEDLGNLLGVAP